MWLADFPFEENGDKSRPVVILSVEPLLFLSVKITSHSQRDYDIYDTVLERWKEAGLSKPSVARVSKNMHLSEDKFLKKLGELHIKDRIAVLKKYISFLQEAETNQQLVSNE